MIANSPFSSTKSAINGKDHGVEKSLKCVARTEPVPEMAQMEQSFFLRPGNLVCLLSAKW
ncbi:hypothetical protein GCM10027180_13810 [Microbulbifer echini]